MSTVTCECGKVFDADLARSDALGDVTLCPECFEGLLSEAAVASRDGFMVAAAHIAEEIFLERERQMVEEGYSVAMDDKYAFAGRSGDLAEAAGVYCSVSGTMLTCLVDLPPCFVPKHWPLSKESFKRSTPRRMLIKAAALLVAQIEMIDRMAVKAKEES